MHEAILILIIGFLLFLSDFMVLILCYFAHWITNTHFVFIIKGNVWINNRHFLKLYLQMTVGTCDLEHFSRSDCNELLKEQCTWMNVKKNILENRVKIILIDRFKIKTIVLLFNTGIPFRYSQASCKRWEIEYFWYFITFVDKFHDHNWNLTTQLKWVRLCFYLLTRFMIMIEILWLGNWVR